MRLNRSIMRRDRLLRCHDPIKPDTIYSVISRCIVMRRDRYLQRHDLSILRRDLCANKLSNER